MYVLRICIVICDIRMLKYGRNMICLRCDYDTNKDECIICHEMNDSDESMMMYDDKYMKCMVSVWYII